MTNEASAPHRAKSIPLLFLPALLLGLVILGRALDIPVGDWLLSVSDRYYMNYGYPAVFLGALLEGILVINFYVPGSTIVILGAVASRGGALSIGLVILVATVGFILAYSVCYILGWFGWYSAFSRLGVERALNRTRERMMAVGPRLIPVANIHPNLGALAATSAGALRIPFVRFILISGTSALLWDIFWGLLAFWLGREAVKLFNGWLLFPVLLVLVLWFLISSRLQKRSPRAPLDGS